MATLLALLSALVFGLTDFGAALLSRRGGAAACAAVVQVGGFVAVLGFVAAGGIGGASLATLAWGLLSGLGTGVGIVFLYRGMRQGQLCVVVPVSAVAAIALPALAGVLFMGERPSMLVYLGIVCAAVALWLVSCNPGPRQPRQAGGAVLGAIAGVGFALQSTALVVPGEPAGYWPLVANRLGAMLTIAALAVPLQWGLSLRWPLVPSAVMLGVAAVASQALYMHAAHLGLMSAAVAISSLYPVVPALLGIYVLHERLSWLQGAGLAAAGAAVVMIALG